MMKITKIGLAIGTTIPSLPLGLHLPLLLKQKLVVFIGTTMEAEVLLSIEAT